MGFLAGKRALIVGVASERSIAWGIAKAMHREGAEIAYTYQNEKLKDRVEKFAQQTGSEITLPCDVANDAEIEAVFGQLGNLWDGLDIIVHSVAYAPLALAHGGRRMMQGRNGALLTLTYLGAERVVPNYNVMGLAKASLEASVRYLAAALGADGIRVNGISAGPIRTLAAAGISDFKKLLDYNDRMAPLRRGVTIDEVGNVAAFLCSDLASGVTGEITFVDAGFNTVAIGGNYAEGA